MGRAPSAGWPPTLRSPPWTRSGRCRGLRLPPPPAREAAGATLAIDAATRANLELMRTQSGERRGSLIAAIDRTVTVAGARMLSQRLPAPLPDPPAVGPGGR